MQDFVGAFQPTNITFIQPRQDITEPSLRVTFPESGSFEINPPAQQEVIGRTGITPTLM